MIIKIISSIDKNSWYAECINNEFNVWEIDDSPFYWADYQLPIFKSDAIIIKNGEEEKTIKKRETTN